MGTPEKDRRDIPAGEDGMLPMPEPERLDLDAEIGDDELAAMAMGEDEFPGLEEFIRALDQVKPPAANEILLPEALENMPGFAGSVYGFLREDSGCHAILGWEGAEPAPELGAARIGEIGGQSRPGEISGAWENGTLVFRWHRDGAPVPLKKSVYTLKQDVFSRNSGLMETDWMDGKCVVVSGCGSVGSCAALQLARSGVGRFVLVDRDCMEIHNVCRHQCDLSDIGRYKVDAVADRIRRINPSAQVRKFYQTIQEVPVSRYADWVTPEDALFLGACDNRVGNAYACDAAYSLGAPFLALGFMARAWGGELFYCLPEKGDVCYRCAFRRQIDSAIDEERRSHTYMNEEDAGTVPFEPGLDVDVEYGVSLADKVALDILNRKNPDYHFRLLDRLSQFTVFSGTGDRSWADPFWAGAFQKPVDYRCVGLSGGCRRSDCEYCGRG